MTPPNAGLDPTRDPTIEGKRISLDVIMLEQERLEKIWERRKLLFDTSKRIKKNIAKNFATKIFAILCNGVSKPK